MSPAQNLRERSATESPGASFVSLELEMPDSLVALLGDAVFGDRRETERHAFPAVQRIAPCRGAAVPTESDFHLVRCHNLSTLGIAFYWPTMPIFDQVIVALALPRGTIRVLARVMFNCPWRANRGSI